MIISASYKTDIPTFYGAWFMNRVRAGWCKIVNPFNRTISTVRLDRSSVEGFVFWTKNVGPFMKSLEELRQLGFPFVVQHTINGYPRELETSVVDAQRSVEHLHQIAALYGARAAVWRYDPVLMTSLTPPIFHLERFGELAAAARGAVDEVVISFAQIYRKTQRNVSLAAKAHGFTWNDPDPDLKRSLTTRMTEIARANGMQLSVCAQKEYAVPGSVAAHCIDSGRLEDVGKRRISAKISGNRPDCECSQSKDIGEYDTCPHGCVYCYSVRERSVAQDRFRKHDPTSEFLFEPPSDARERTSTKSKSLPLFPDE
jgi:hypothetical protein